jgi:hypothetical protein
VSIVGIEIPFRLAGAWLDLAQLCPNYAYIQHTKTRVTMKGQDCLYMRISYTVS